METEQLRQLMIATIAAPMIQAANHNAKNSIGDRDPKYEREYDIDNAIELAELCTNKIFANRS